MTVKKKNFGNWIFLSIILIGFAVIYVLDANKALLILNKFKKITMQIIPILVLVYIVLLLTNYFISNKIIKKYMGENAGAKTWIIAIVSGIFSIGPIYMWYPLMKDLQEKGVQNKYLVTFLYNRAIKPQWLPILIAYYGIKYSLTLLVVMAVFSIPQGIITEKLIHKNNSKK